MSQKLFVVLGDVVSSRDIKDRVAFKASLDAALDDINSLFVSRIFAPFKTLKGLDEIGGVLKDISDLLEIILLINDRIYPDSVRIICIFDSIDTGLSMGDVSRMDGRAFHRASECIASLKESRLLFGLSARNDVADPAIEGAINLLLMARQSWSPRQHEIYREYRRSKRQRPIAQALGISRQYVSKALKVIRADEMMLVEESLNCSLQRYSQKISGRYYAYLCPDDPGSALK